VSTQIQVIVHDIEADGLPDMSDDALTGRVALIFDGSVVSGWPLKRGPADQLWEADTDVGRAGPFYDVTHWLEFPVPIWELTGG